MRIARVVGTVLRALLALALVWGAGLAWFIAAAPRAAPVAARTDAIVVLTGDEGRIARGLALLKAGAAPRMLISGVGTGVRAADLARAAGAPIALFHCCVTLGGRATDTRSNAEETAAWVRANHVRSLRLVTSDYHVRRAGLELAAELPPDTRILPDPVPSRPRLRPYVREYHKWLVRLLARRAGAA